MESDRHERPVSVVGLEVVSHSLMLRFAMVLLARRALAAHPSVAHPLATE